MCVLLPCRSTDPDFQACRSCLQSTSLLAALTSVQLVTSSTCVSNLAVTSRRWAARPESSSDLIRVLLAARRLWTGAVQRLLNRHEGCRLLLSLVRTARYARQTLGTVRALGKTLSKEKGASHLSPPLKCTEVGGPGAHGAEAHERGRRRAQRVRRSRQHGAGESTHVQAASPCLDRLSRVVGYSSRSLAQSYLKASTVGGATLSLDSKPLMLQQSQMTFVARWSSSASPIRMPILRS